MSRRVAGFAWYRFVATARQRSPGYVTVLLLIGLLGGLSMGAAAAARRTQSSYAELAARTNSSDLFGLVGIFNPTIGLNTGYDPSVPAAIAHLRGVKDVETEVGLNLDPLGPDGTPPAAASGFAPNGSVDGMRFDQDRFVVKSGRLADTSRPDEFVADAATAKQFGWRVGQTVTFGAYTNAQAQLPATATSAVPADQRIQVKLVGLVVGADGVVQDDVDGHNLAIVEFTPALTRRLLSCCANDAVSGVQLDGGAAAVPAVEAEVAPVLPKGLPFEFSQVSIIKAKADRAIKPDAIALATFGGLAGLAALVIAAQVIGRQLRQGGVDLGVLRALGADPAMTMSDGLPGVLGAVVGGGLLAAALAIGLSPLAPLGPVRPFLPTGFDPDWTVLGAGLIVLIGGLGVFALVIAYREAPHRRAVRVRRRASSAAYAAGAAGLPVSPSPGFASPSSRGPVETVCPYDRRSSAPPWPWSW